MALPKQLQKSNTETQEDLSQNLKVSMEKKKSYRIFLPCLPTSRGSSLSPDASQKKNTSQVTGTEILREPIRFKPFSKFCKKKKKKGKKIRKIKTHKKSQPGT